uniref:Putative glycine-rich RNA-binding protein 2 n=1 Tax=Bambusa oldhamii TaxID=58923 RepID=B5KLZ7_BAMOL|nr:putative glycine-rich RNA-binding protein 2 [Bambusa oldhamii]
MAAFNKLGSLFRHSALASSASTGSTPAMFNAARLMSTKLFVGGLSWGTDDQSLKDAFTSFGEVVEARVITDRDTGKSRGFGFVSFSNGDDAKNAMSSMDGQELEGRNIHVNFANERPAGNRGFSGGGSYGGGGGGAYGGGYGSGNQSYGNSSFGGSGGQDVF